MEDPREAVEAILEVPGWVEGPTILEECKVEEGMTGTLGEGAIIGGTLGEIGEAIGTRVGGTECSLESSISIQVVSMTSLQVTFSTWNLR